MTRYRLYPTAKPGWQDRRSARDRLEPVFELGVLLLWLGLAFFALTWSGQ